MQKEKISGRIFKFGLVAALACFITFCGGEPDHPEGLMKSGGGGGPEVIFDPLAKPVPEIPMPNDLIMVLDESSVTGRRINLSTEAPTEVERRMRRKLNQLDGFGTYQPITVAFNKPLDLSTVNEDNIMVIKLEGADAGKTTPLNLPEPGASYTSPPYVTENKGFFPLLWRPDDPWWRHDPLGDANNVALDPENGVDLNGDGAISADEFVSYYEFRTNTLIIQPIIPLDEASRYAVVLLKGLKGANGEPVKSPFEYINHTMQTEDLSALPGLLRDKGIALEQVAFCWSFTTQSITRDWKNVWNGLTKGTGPLAYLNKAFQPVLHPANLGISGDFDGNKYTLNADWFAPIAYALLAEAGEAQYLRILDLKYVDYFVFGTFKSPSFFSSLDFRDPLVSPGISFDPSKLSGEERAYELEVPWMLAVPRDEDAGIDGCSNELHPFGCPDYEENCPWQDLTNILSMIVGKDIGTEVGFYSCVDLLGVNKSKVIKKAKGPDGEWGNAGVDDDGDTTIDNQSEYLASGSDDVKVPTGADGEFGVAGVDDNGDGYIGDEGEYMWPGSDDIADPAGDNYDPNDPDCDWSKWEPDGPGYCVPSTVRITPELVKCTEGNGRLDYDCGDDGQPGAAGVDEDGNTVADNIGEFGLGGDDGNFTEDANFNGRLDTPPFPVAFYGHGHTLSGFESIGFAEPLSMHGIGLFGMDSFGHGPSDLQLELPRLLQDLMANILDKTCELSGGNWNYDECGTISSLLALMGVSIPVDGRTGQEILNDILNLGFFKVLTTQGRAYDTDGDGQPNSGRIFFTANVFQTRDAVRQTAIDWMQFVRIADNFGTLSVNDLNDDGTPDLEGDFNLDGQYDLGGPTSVNTRGHYYLGSSLGGIMGVVNMAVNPRMKVGAPVSGAGGLPDVIPRSHQTSATDPVMRQMCGPIVVGDAMEPGWVRLVFNDDPPEKSFGYLAVPPYGRIKVENLTNGESKVVTANPDSSFSAGIPADVGDLIKVTSLDEHTHPYTVKTRSLYQGLGLDRNSPNLRRLTGMAQWIIERGDAINLAKHYFTNEFGSPITGSPEKGVLLINTIGDANVPINTGNAIATAAGLWSLDEAKTLLRAGLNLGYIPPPWGTSLTDAPVFDPEDLDDDGRECGFDDAERCNYATSIGVTALNPPLSVVKSPTSDRVSAIRWPYINEKGHHAFALPGDINHGIDWGVYMANQIGYYFASEGTCVIDDPWALHAAPMIHPGPDRRLDTPADPEDHVKEVPILHTLGANPCDYNFPTVSVITTKGRIKEEYDFNAAGSASFSLPNASGRGPVIPGRVKIIRDPDTQNEVVVGRDDGYGNIEGSSSGTIEYEDEDGDGTSYEMVLKGLDGNPHDYRVEYYRMRHPPQGDDVFLTYDKMLRGPVDPAAVGIVQ